MWGRLFVIPVLICFCSCQSTNNSSEFQEDVKQRLVDFACQIYSPDSSKIICKEISKKDISQVSKIETLIVLNLKDSSILFQENLQYIGAYWVDNHTITVTRGLGIASQNEGRETFKLDLNTKQKTILKEDSEFR